MASAPVAAINLALIAAMCRFITASELFSKPCAKFCPASCPAGFAVAAAAFKSVSNLAYTPLISTSILPAIIAHSPHADDAKVGRRCFRRSWKAIDDDRTRRA